jgi:hypothetical protein
MPCFPYTAQNHTVDLSFKMLFFHGSNIPEYREVLHFTIHTRRSLHLIMCAVNYLNYIVTDHTQLHGAVTLTSW